MLPYAGLIPRNTAAASSGAVNNPAVGTTPIGTTGDSTAPTVISVSPSDNTFGAYTGSISITFSESMNITNLSSITSNGACSGTIQISSNEFVNCLGMTNALPSMSTGDTIATVIPLASLLVGIRYKIRVTSNATDIIGNNILTAYTSATGFMIKPILSQAFAGIQTIAGSFPPPTVTSGNIDGISTSARFNNPIAITMDSVNIYVADIFNSSVRKVRISDGYTTTLASITGPHGVATDGSNVYVTSYNTHKVFKVSILSGTVTTLAGTGVSGDVIGPAATAQFNTPTYLTTDGTYVYVSDRGNGKIKQIDIATGNVTTVSSGFIYPMGIATDGTNIYVADTNANIVYRVLISTGVKTLIAGTGVAGGVDNAIGASATLNAPWGITFDGSFIYVLEGAGKRFRRISTTSPYEVATIVAQSNGYADGVFGIAQFCAGGTGCDSSITTDGVTIYMADRFTNSIRKLYY